MNIIIAAEMVNILHGLDYYNTRTQKKLPG